MEGFPERQGAGTGGAPGAGLKGWLQHIFCHKAPLAKTNTRSEMKWKPQEVFILEKEIKKCGAKKSFSSTPSSRAQGLWMGHRGRRPGQSKSRGSIGPRPGSAAHQV